MRLWLAAVGRLRSGPLRDLYQDYAGRLGWPLILKEVEIRKRAPAAELKRLESEALLATLPPGAVCVALDERGVELSSVEFAARIGAWRDGAIGDIAFLIGGADGLSESVRERADLVLALGRMTWPHLLVRILVVEQLYRAQQILAGHPYHRS